MRTIHTHGTLPEVGPSVFLAGPTPRSSLVASWRPEALRILEATGFVGAVLSPETSDGIPLDQPAYPDQVAWERAALRSATVVLFWVPRHPADLPGFTTNIEFGFVSERRQPYVLGFPVDAPKMRYLEWVARDQGAPVRHTLADTVAAAVELIG